MGRQLRINNDTWSLGAVIRSPCKEVIVVEFCSQIASVSSRLIQNGRSVTKAKALVTHHAEPLASQLTSAVKLSFCQQLSSVFDRDPIITPRSKRSIIQTLKGECTFVRQRNRQVNVSYCIAISLDSTSWFKACIEDNSFTRSNSE